MALQLLENSLSPCPGQADHLPLSIWWPISGRSFDHKPALAQHHGSDIFKHVEQQGRLTGFNNNRKILPVINSRYSFAQHGQTGSWTSELLPHIAGIADDLCTIRSMTTIPINHDPAMTFMQTGHNLPGPAQYGLMVELWTGHHEPRHQNSSTGISGTYPICNHSTPVSGEMDSFRANIRSALGVQGQTMPT